MNLVDLVKRHEGFHKVVRRSPVPTVRPYVCPANVLTIGYGTTRIAGRPVTKDTPEMDEPTAAALLEADLERTGLAVDRLVTVPLHGGQRSALVSFAYNLGVGALKSSTLLRKVNALEWDDVPAQFRRWIYGGGRPLPGLVRRREDEAALFAGLIGPGTG